MSGHDPLQERSGSCLLATVYFVAVFLTAFFFRPFLTAFFAAFLAAFLRGAFPLAFFFAITTPPFIQQK